MQAGKYKARASAVAMGVASTGNEQIIISFSLDTGDSISWYGYFSERAWERTVESLRICGWTGEDLSDFDAGQLAGLDTHDVELVVEQEVDMEGVPRARVRWINTLRGSGILVKQPLAGADLKGFAAKMKGKILALDKSSGTKPARPASRSKPRQDEQVNDDDSMPF
jgi:hypothetical protein